MSADIPDWHDEYRQEVARIEEVQRATERARNQATKDKLEELALPWKPLQNGALFLIGRWQKLEIDRVFSQPPFTGKVGILRSDPAAIRVVMKDKDGQEIEFIHPDPWKSLSHYLAELSKTKGYSPKDVLFSHIEKDVLQSVHHSGGYMDPGESWDTYEVCGKVKMTPSEINLNNDIKIPLSGLGSPRDLEQKLYKILTERLRNK